MTKRFAWPVWLVAGAALLLVTAVPGSPAQASHGSIYHWARTANPFVVQIDNNMSVSWQTKLATAVSDWSSSSVFDLNVNTGSFGSTSTCDPQLGHVEVCNDQYGTTGWTGLAQVYFDANNHIVRGDAMMNDTYLKRGSYPDAYDQLTICQEIGHNLGLNHQDEITTNANLGTCMDYTNDADGPPSNEHPDSHDYAELESIYSHLDSYNTSGAALVSATDESTWGRPLRSSDADALYLRTFAAGGGVLTFVTWA